VLHRLVTLEVLGANSTKLDTCSVRIREACSTHPSPHFKLTYVPHIDPFLEYSSGPPRIHTSGCNSSRSDTGHDRCNFVQSFLRPDRHFHSQTVIITYR